MDKRISGALAWGGLALLIGIPSSEVLLNRDSGPEMMAAEVGTQSWADSEQWPNGRPAGQKTGDSQDVPVPDGLQAGAPEHSAAAEETVSPHPPRSEIRAIGADPRYRVAVQPEPGVPGGGLVLEQHATSPAPTAVAAGETPVADDLALPQNLTEEVALAEANDARSSSLPYPAPVSLRPATRVGHTLPSQRPAQPGFEDEVRQSIANIEAQRGGYDDRYSDFEVNGSYDDFDEIVAYEPPPAPRTEADIFYDSDAEFWGSQVESRDGEMLEPFDPGPFNGPRHSRESWRATSRGGEYLGPVDGYVKGDRLPAVRDGAVRLDLLQ